MGNISQNVGSHLIIASSYAPYFGNVHPPATPPLGLYKFPFVFRHTSPPTPKKDTFLKSPDYMHIFHHSNIGDFFNYFFRELWKVFSKQIIAKIGHGQWPHFFKKIIKKKLITHRGDLWIRARYLKQKKNNLIQFIIILLSQCGKFSKENI